MLILKLLKIFSYILFFYFNIIIQQLFKEYYLKIGKIFFSNIQSFFLKKFFDVVKINFINFISDNIQTNKKIYLKCF
jgi:hypothetical protein